MSYTVEHLLDAYVRAIGRPLYGLAAYRTWDEYTLECMCRCFGVSYEGSSAAHLRAILAMEANLPHPLQHYLEAGLLIRLFEEPLKPLDERCRALGTFYRQHARTAAAALWGDVGERTREQLVAAGWDPAREPNLDDYMDEI
jgi:hypothetical protein